MSMEQDLLEKMSISTSEENNNEVEDGLVTGGGSGIGEAIVRRFHREGDQLTIFDINGAAARDVAAGLRSEPKVLVFKGDVSSEADAKYPWNGRWSWVRSTRSRTMLELK